MVAASLCILFLTNAHNSMSQKAYLVLSELGHKIHVEIAHSEAHMVAAFEKVRPDVVICPFLTKRVPEEIWANAPTLIVHPGIKGDRGASSLDYALREDAEEWGVTILQAAEEMDAGDIYCSINFKMAREDINTLTKSSLYKNEVIDAAVNGLKQSIEKIMRSEKPEPLNYANTDVKGTLRPNMKLSDRKINWNDHAEKIAREVRAADGRPGVLSNIAGIPVFLHGAHVELNLNKGQDAEPGKLIAKRHEAVCIACGEGTALWFTALRRKNEGADNHFKLPALMALPKSVTQNLVESKVEVEGAPEGTWKDIWTNTVDGICYINFNFHNGAMSTSQCKRLAKVIRDVGAMPSVKIVVLMGGLDYFSNGIHLNVIEAASDPAQESWENINAIDDVVLAVMSIKDKVTVSAFQGNAGAGGVMMGLAADFVYMGDHVVLNPHYKSMHLYGSEYWTYNLPKRVGEAMATKLTEGMQPLSGKEAKAIGLVDDVFGNFYDFKQLLEKKVDSLNTPNFLNTYLAQKTETRNTDFFNEIQAARDVELKVMKEINFQDPMYIQARRRFVYKESCGCTPAHFPKLAVVSCKAE